MTKKGGIQQLQTECNTDEELDKFLEKEGILVLDVYADWCGSCIGMVGSLKKIKLELGGDDLQLAVCRADDIEKLTRFRNKSEPTWLVCTKKKILRMLKGTNVPKLMTIITFELCQMNKIRKGEMEDDRLMFEFHELTPEEQDQQTLRSALEEEVVRIELEEAIRLRREYIRHVTDQIMEHVTDAGITLFFPQTLKEAYRKTADIGDKMELTCKERKCVKIKPEMMEILNFEVDNPMSDDLMSYLYHREILIFLWKLGETDTRAPEEVLKIFHRAVAEPIPILNDQGDPTDNVLPALLETVEVNLEEEKSRSSTPSVSRLSIKSDRRTSIMNVLEEKKAADLAAKKGSDGRDSGGSNMDAIDEEPKPLLKVPACWTPHNKRANAAYIYIFFRNHTDHFLPVDPIPEPPHLCFVFDAYKKHYIFELCKQYPNDLLAFGFFNSGDIENCTLLARTCDRYDKLKPSVNDKLVMKIAKTATRATYAVSNMGPQYISINTVQGQIDCIRLFPEGFKNEDSEVEEEINEEENDSEKKKKRKKKKKKRVQAEGDTDVSQSATIDGQVSAQDSEDNTLDELSEDETPSQENLEIADGEPPQAPAPTPNP